MRVLFSMLIVCIWLSAAAQSGQTEMSKAIGQMQQLYGDGKACERIINKILEITE